MDIAPNKKRKPGGFLFEIGYKIPQNDVPPPLDLLILLYTSTAAQVGQTTLIIDADALEAEGEPAARASPHAMSPSWSVASVPVMPCRET